jgi:hypothetical protein
MTSNSEMVGSNLSGRRLYLLSVKIADSFPGVCYNSADLLKSTGARLHGSTASKHTSVQNCLQASLPTQQAPTLYIISFSILGIESDSNDPCL